MHESASLTPPVALDSMDDGPLIHSNTPASNRKRGINMRLLINPSSHSLVPQSPLTPASVFSFELTESPGYSATPRNISWKKTSQQLIFSFEPSDLPTIEERRPSEIETEEENEWKGEEGTKETLPLTNWRNIRLVAIVLFLVRIQFTVYFASLYSMLREMDHEMTPFFFSSMNAVYSMGVSISAPLYGYLTKKYGFKQPAATTLLLMFITHCLYVTVDNVPNNRRFFVLFIRILVGIAAGGSSILNIYWSTVTAERDRATAASYTDASFSLGIAFGPLFQLCFSLIGYPGVRWRGISINMYTVPAIMAALIVIVASFLMLFLFDEGPTDKADKECEEKSEEEKCQQGREMDSVAVAACIVVKTAQMFFYANIETINSMFIQWMFSFDTTETTEFASFLVSMTGFIGFGFMIMYIWTGVAKRVDDRLALLFGVLVCILFLLCTYPYAFYSSFISSPDCVNAWCSSTPRIPISLYFVSYLLLFGIGFPILNVHAAALLSSLLSSSNQTVWHGTSMFVATLSRVVGPPSTTLLITAKGISLVWSLQIVIMSSVFIMILLLFNRLDALYDDYVKRRNTQYDGFAAIKPRPDSGPNGRTAASQRYSQSAARRSGADTYSMDGYQQHTSQLGEDPITTVRTMRNNLRRQAIMERESGRDMKAKLCDNAIKELSSKENELITLNKKKTDALMQGNLEESEKIRKKMYDIKDDAIRNNYADLITDDKQIRAYGVDSKWARDVNETREPQPRMIREPSPIRRAVTPPRQRSAQREYSSRNRSQTTTTTTVVRSSSAERYPSGPRFVPDNLPVKERRARSAARSPEGNIAPPRRAPPPPPPVYFPPPRQNSAPQRNDYDVKKNERLSVYERKQGQTSMTMLDDDPYKLPTYYGRCPHCDKIGDNFARQHNMDEHFEYDCKVMTNCRYCHKVVLVAELTDHYIARCDFLRDKKVRCRKCGLATEREDDEADIDHPLCRKRFPPNGAMWCPLCAVAVPDTHDGWIAHLTTTTGDGCYNNPRNDKTDPNAKQSLVPETLFFTNNPNRGYGNGNNGGYNNGGYGPGGPGGGGPGGQGGYGGAGGNQPPPEFVGPSVDMRGKRLIDADQLLKALKEAQKRKKAQQKKRAQQLRAEEKD